MPFINRFFLTYLNDTANFFNTKFHWNRSLKLDFMLNFIKRNELWVIIAWWVFLFSVQLSQTQSPGWTNLIFIFQINKNNLILGAMFYIRLHKWFIELSQNFNLIYFYFGTSRSSSTWKHIKINCRAFTYNSEILNLFLDVLVLFLFNLFCCMALKANISNIYFE